MRAATAVPGPAAQPARMVAPPEVAACRLAHQIPDLLVVAALVEAAEEALRHFTKTPSSLADTTVRGKLHAALAALEDK